ncbi:hypothetical protein AUI46_04285 [archaeon 13_1_40CM_2_52_13]|nr:MAG: hypothetical protein AUI46_04285 [archaeon 13_1_40CM_2_52_13]OLE69355.1 MAG: hypothetical protein AUF78_11410 [archaeon 13_1_20CM_2_51_12]
MSEEERIFAEHEIREREYFAANAREAARRTQEKLRIAELEERRRWFDFSQGVPRRVYTDEELNRKYPDPAENQYGHSDQRPFQAPQGVSLDDRFPNSHSASIYQPTAAQQLWYEALARLRPQNRSESQRFSTEQLGSTFSINSLRERRR